MHRLNSSIPHRILISLTLTSLIAFSAMLRGDTENWPNFRGPIGNGVAPADANPPIEFGPDKNLKWKVSLPGQGHSSPVVWEDRIYLMSAVSADLNATG